MAMLFCETCGGEVQPCGHCRGSGWVYAVDWERGITLHIKTQCPGCHGTGTFCRHASCFTPEQRARLEALKGRISPAF